MLEIKDLDKLKITRVRNWRINFRYDGVLYSLNCHEDGYDSSIVLTNRDTMEYIFSEYGNLYVNHYGLMSIFWTQKVKLFYAALLANNSH